MKFTFKLMTFLVAASFVAEPIFAKQDNSDSDLDDQYPKTREERRDEELGSILGGKGITFSPSKIRNESTKNIKETETGAEHINSYLWHATLEVIDFAPLNSVDSNGGVIITDWYAPKGNPKVNYKINVIIKDNIISPEALEVKVFAKAAEHNKVSTAEDKNMKVFASSLEDKILRKARELYIKDHKAGK